MNTIRLWTITWLLTALAAAGAVAATPLSLDEARSRALANDEQLAQVRETVAGARADALAAGADRLPQLSLAGTWTRNFKKPGFFLSSDMAAAFGGSSYMEVGGDWDLEGAATLSWNVWTSGRLSAARGAAAEALSATEWLEALTADAVVLAVDVTYADVLLAREELAIAEESRDLARESHRLTKASFDEGKSSRYDLLRAEVELANREAPVVQAANDLDVKLLRLKRACGLAPDEEIEPTDGFAEVADPAPAADLRAAMIAASPELKALNHQVRAAEMGVSLAKAGRGPVVQLQGQYVVQGQWDDDLWPDGDETLGSTSAALVVSVPIFDGFATKAAILGGEADLRSARLELERVTRDRELGVQEARANLVSALTALDGRRESVALAEEAYRLAEIRLENGLATPLERLDAELALTEARVQLAESLYACDVAESNLTFTLGGVAASAGYAQENER